MAEVLIEIHVLDAHLTVGEWCPHCSLPSAIRLPFVGVDPATLNVVLRAATFACRACGQHWNEDAGDP